MIVLAINKVEYSGNTLIDLTSDTVTAESLVAGVTAHDAKGNKITGVLVGQDGKSAYEIAVDEGFTGTAEEWLLSLKGDKGDPGEKGDTYTLTDTDKNEIAQEVLALIPDGNEVAY